jgi:murein DD-endopeptidase MepM/ murein hydrolase activator NlpD
MQQTFAKDGGGILGGPGQAPPTEGYGILDTELFGVPAVQDPTPLPAGNGSTPARIALLESGALSTVDSSVVSLPQVGVVTYTVQKGDTLSGIAADFGVSVQTIIGSNPEVKNTVLSIGQTLNILPVSGVLYRVRGGETAETIADSFNISVSQLAEFNRSVDLATIGDGTLLIIPGATPHDAERVAANTPQSKLPNYPGYYQQPAEGFNWGQLHNYNAVDIANTCGTPIIAAAEGLVVDAASSGWNQGYGNYIMIEHPNGTKTRYAHLETLKVSIGDYVKGGDQIATMGETGEATGCHVHFEVYGARNPLAR